MISEKDIIERMKAPIFLIGVSLVFAGSFALLYIAYVLLNLIQSPLNSELLIWVSENIANEKFFVSGQINQSPFELSASPVLQYLFYGFIGLCLIGVLSSIINGRIQPRSA